MPQPSDTASLPVKLAEPRKDGKWIMKDGVLHFKDGHLHKIETAGQMHRSGESFGISTTFYTVAAVAGSAPQSLRGRIEKQTIANGLLMSSEVVDANAEVIVE